ncbi:MAG: hypothetical protein H6618_08225 [Deltaproteobacteria bacterium]|nr:hypothetical protein [Deltaproteobacteria bacterium]
MRFFALSFISIIFSSTLALARVAPPTVSLKIEEIFAISKGFDANDHVEIAVRGTLQDSCQKVGTSSADVDLENGTISVRVEGYRRDSGACLQMITPYLEIVPVGHLPAGNYQVLDLSGHAAAKSLSVNPSDHPGPDDYLYAPVDRAMLSAPSAIRHSFESSMTDSSSQTLVLEGAYPRFLKGCMRVQEVRAYYSGNIMVVQPIARLFGNQPDDPDSVPECREGADQYNRFRISKEVKLPVLRQGLLHVRTPNGKSLNRLVDFWTPSASLSRM